MCIKLIRLGNARLFQRAITPVPMLGVCPYVYRKGAVTNRSMSRSLRASASPMLSRSSRIWISMASGVELFKISTGE